MTTMKLDHTYVSVIDLDRAIAFYEDLLGMKVSHYEKDQWADFDTGNGCYFGLIDPRVTKVNRKVGNNSTPVFYCNNIDEMHEKIKGYGVKISFPPTDLDFTTYRYYCFECEDTEGNLIEIVDYEK